MNRIAVVVVIAALVLGVWNAMASAQAPARPPAPGASVGPGAGPGSGMMAPGGMGPGMMGPGMGRPQMPGMRGMDGDRGRAAKRPVITLMLHHRQQLGLGDEQVAKLRELRSVFEKEAIRARADLRIAEVDLDDLLDQDQVDLAQAESLVRRQEGVRSSLRLARIKAVEQAKAVLTAEQRQRLRRLVDGMSEGRPGPGMMRHGMMPGMMGPEPVAPRSGGHSH